MFAHAEILVALGFFYRTSELDTVSRHVSQSSMAIAWECLFIPLPKLYSATPKYPNHFLLKLAGIFSKTATDFANVDFAA
jgi:hypothetical protein